MKQLKFAVSKILFINVLFAQCHPVRYQTQKISDDYRYTSFPYQHYSPMDAYEAPSMQSRMYYRGDPYPAEERSALNSTFPFSDFINVLNDLEYHHENQQHNPGHENSYYYPGLRDSSHANNDVKHPEVESTAATKSTTVSPLNNGVSVSFLKPDWSSIVRPAPSNMDKWSGLLQLILAFITGSRSGNVELRGFQDIIVNGILRPILAAKGNIRSFVSKITIPLLSLVLINIEMLVTVWWLWEDSPTDMNIRSVNQSVFNQTST